MKRKARTRKWRLFLLATIVLCFGACDHTSEDRGKTIDRFFSGLRGLWQVEGESSFEEWEMGPDSTFRAQAYAMLEGDTLISEHIRVIQQEGSWYYEATVAGQNNGHPVLFKLMQCSDTSMTFSNNEHDFPQTIRYQKINETRMKAVISGEINGERRSYEFNYIKVKKRKKVTGVGGIFFKAEDPAKMREWYGTNLGLATNEYGSLFEFRLSEEPEKKGYLQWSPFPENTEYFEPSKKEFMINFRVENIEELVEELKKSGVTVLDSIETYEYGKFVHILDPENNKIELWEPVDSDFTRNYEGETTK